MSKFAGMIPPNPISRSTESKKVQVRLSVDLLEIGMYVAELDRPWTELPVLMQGIQIETPEDIEMIQERCVYVFIEVDEALWRESYSSSTPIAAKPKKQFTGFKVQRDIHEELPDAKIALDSTQDHIDQVLENINNGEAFDLEESRRAVKACVTSIVNNANAMLWLCKIKDEDQYTSEHCMRVGILAIAFGRFLGLKENELELLGLCGMLHDVGKVKVPSDILNKPGKLTNTEYAIMKEHAVLGKQVLEEIPGMDQLVIDTAHLHHERIDGKGYPSSMFAEHLHRYIRMISIVDVYDAITSTRPYQESRPAFDALKILFSEVDRHFDRELVEAFIRMIGIYPPGTLVEMTNGEIGIVVSSNPNSRLRPKVELVATADKKRRKPYVIDLANEIMDENGRIYAIKSGLSNKSYGIDIGDYINPMKQRSA